MGLLIHVSTIHVLFQIIFCGRAFDVDDYFSVVQTFILFEVYQQSGTSQWRTEWGEFMYTDICNMGFDQLKGGKWPPL